MKRNFWQNRENDIKYILQWYPHWGSKVLTKELGIPQKTILNKMFKMKIYRLPRQERICYGCKINKQAEASYCGLLCINCRKEHKHKYNFHRYHLAANTVDNRLREMVNVAKSRSNKNGRDCNITFEFLQEMWKKQNGKCFYTGRNMSVRGRINGKRDPDTMSIDRIDSSKGYTTDNVVLCSNWANLAKETLTKDDLVSRCRSVIEHCK